MAAYLIAQHNVTDASKLKEYRSKVGPMFAKHGARYLTEGGHKLLEGGHWNLDRVVIIEFPDMAALNAWNQSPEYQSLIPLRRAAMSELILITLEGV
jgi:uncharacterized protein (DUF1330 family)